MVDVFIVAVLVGIAAAVWIRKVVRPRRFDGSHLGEADLILFMIALVVLTLLGWHAARIAAGLNEWPAQWSFLSNAVSHLVGSGASVRERILVWAHVGVILTFLCYLPYSKHLHIATAAINVYFSRTRRPGRLEPLRFDVPEAELRFGAGTIRDLTWKEMVDSFSCTECGRCQDVCPAYATGKSLSPKLVIMGIRDQVFAEGPNLLAGGELTPIAGNGVPEDMIWDCVTCGACVHECPVSIEHIDHIVDLRRDLVMVQSSFPAEAESMLRDVERVGNPWGKPQGDRESWAEGLGVRVVAEGEPAPEILYWVGCAAAYDERARVAAESTVKLLQKAGVDFAILGARESCTGDPARRMGNEYVFQAYAEQNVATLNETGVTKIVASCPHCLNSLGNEYPDFGGRYEVVHHTQLLAELLRDGKLEPAKSETEITYHDSCYLARHNDVAAEPRELVAAVGKPVEMEKHGKNTFCCGAGGAHMWMEERGSPINEERVRQAAETGAETLAVACPFCTVMLDDGVRASGKQLRVVDVSTLLLEGVSDT
jgi:Fe-S oxidoreductase